jgi:hypothetical protein
LKIAFMRDLAGDRRGRTDKQVARATRLDRIGRGVAARFAGS